MKTHRPAPPPGINRWTLRFVLLGGGLAWLLHLLGAYLIAEFGILSGLVESRWAGLDAVSVLLLLLSAAMLALAGSATAVAWHRRGPRKQGATGPDEERNTARFCARFGFAANLTFLAIIAAQTIPLFYFLRV